jgi:N-methylhydantoinase B
MLNNKANFPSLEVQPLKNQTKSTDPVTTEIIRTAIIATTDEMKTNLMRSAYNPIIYEALDYTVGLFDAKGNTVSIGLGLPMFIGGLSDAIKAMNEFYGPDGIKKGDILLTNDPFTMGSHLNNVIIALPLFWENELIGFASSMAHWQDIGGTLSGTTTDVYSEGLQIPIVKIFKQGTLDLELMEIIKSNVRLSEQAVGDFWAQIASVRTGEKRFLQIVERFGKDSVLDSIQIIMDQSETLARKAVEAIPDGVYEASSFLDDDGVTNEPIPINVRVIIKGDKMTVDLSNMSPQVKGYYNSGESAGRSAAQVAFKCLTTPLLTPINDGSFRPLEVILPPGTVVSARKPAATRNWMNVPDSIVDTVIKALSPASPHLVAAAHHCDLIFSTTYGTNPKTNQFFLIAEGLIGGGWGAKNDEDGMNATICINDGDTHNTPVEALETKFPLRVEKYELRPDSGGSGRYRGGLGAVRAYKALSPMALNTGIDRTQCAPWGLEGGKSALPNKVTVIRHDSDGSELQFPNGKLSSYHLEEGDMYILYSGGGGGFGNPLERPAKKVHDDVVKGYVSVEKAREDYGVVIDPESLQLDNHLTSALRKKLSSN